MNESAIVMTCFKNAVFLTVVAVGGVGFAGVDGVDPRMDRSKFLIGAYCFRSAAHDEAHVRDLKECGIDFVHGVKVSERATLDLLQKYGIGAIAEDLVRVWCGGNGAWAGTMRMRRPKAAYEEKLAEYVSAGDHPAIWMINLSDEPSALDMPYIGEMCGLFASRLPHVPAYVNLYPNYASLSRNTGRETRSQIGTKTYAEYIDTYCRTVPLDYISYDFYLYTPDAKRRPSLYRQMYDNFNIVADACRRTGRSLMYVPQVNSHNAVNFEPTTCNRLRFQAYTSMAFGAESVCWACWMPGWWTNNVLTADGKKTAQYERLKAVNSELRRFGGRYMQYRTTATHYVGFPADSVLNTLGITLVDFLDTAFFRGLRTLEGSPLVVGEMMPRGKDDGSRALFAVASGDPFDYAPCTRTLVFNVPPGQSVEAYGSDGPIDLVREADGSYTFQIAENSAAMLVSRRRKRADEAKKAKKAFHASCGTSALPEPIRTLNMSRLDKIGPYEITVPHGTLRLAGSQAAPAEPPSLMKMTERGGGKVMVARPRGTGIIRVAAGAAVEIDAAKGKATPPLAFAGAGRVVKKGHGALVIGPGVPSPNVSVFELLEGSVEVRGGRMPTVDVLSAGENWDVRVVPDRSAKTPEQMNNACVRICKTDHGSMTLSKTGNGELEACRIAGEVRRLTVGEGVLRLVVPTAGCDKMHGENLIADPGFEKESGIWEKYVYDDGDTYARQYSTPFFPYETDSWAFGYTVIDGEYCARIHNNGGVASAVDFPAPGRYRLTMHLRSRADQKANAVFAFVELGNGEKLEICRIQPPYMPNFLEYSYVFHMPEQGRRRLVLTGLGIRGKGHESKRLDYADINTIADGVTLVREDDIAAAERSVENIIPEQAHISVAEGAGLAIDVPVTNTVQSLVLGNQTVKGLVTAELYPDYISGVGALYVRACGAQPVKMSKETKDNE